MILGILIKNDFFPDKVYNIGYESIVASIAITLTWYKMFYFLKLFGSTAFFINLLKNSFQDKNFKSFLIMTAFLLMAFANILYVLNTERGESLRYTENNLYHNDNIYESEISDSPFLNAIIYSFKLSLGDFNTNGFRGGN